MKKYVPLFTENKNPGRPVKYDFSGFKNPSVKYIVLPGLTTKNYDSLRSAFCRWRRIENIVGRFEYDFLDATDKEPCAIAIWRSGEF